MALLLAGRPQAYTADRRPNSLRGAAGSAGSYAGCALARLAGLAARRLLDLL